MGLICPCTRVLHSVVFPGLLGLSLQFVIHSRGPNARLRVPVIWDSRSAWGACHLGVPATRKNGVGNQGLASLAWLCGKIAEFCAMGRIGGRGGKMYSSCSSQHIQWAVQLYQGEAQSAMCWLCICKDVLLCLARWSAEPLYHARRCITFSQSNCGCAHLRSLCAKQRESSDLVLRWRLMCLTAETMSVSPATDAGIHDYFGELVLSKLLHWYWQALKK